MNELTTFNHESFGSIRTTVIDDEPLFVAADVCTALGISNNRMATDRLDDDEKDDVSLTDTMGRKQTLTAVTESGLYSLILGSRKKEAKVFKRWVTHDVLPAIRKTGAYQLPKMSTTEVVAQLAQINVEFEKRLDGFEDKLVSTEKKLDDTLKACAQPDSEHWRSDMDELINQMSETYHLSPMGFRARLYRELELTAVSVNLDYRLRNLKARMQKQGWTYREVKALTKLDVISKNKKFRAIFESLLQKYETLYSPIEGRLN